MVETFILGALAFTVTGIDDFFVLLSFHLLHPKKFKAVLFGTLIGLIAVIIPSYLLSSFLNQIPFLRNISISIIASVVLAWLGYNLIKEFFSKEEDSNSEVCLEKTNKDVVLASGIAYFLNGLDDFLIYSSFYLDSHKGFQDEFLFTLGIIGGLMIFGIVTSFLGEKSLKLGEKKTKNIKLSVGIIMILIALILVC